MKIEDIKEQIFNHPGITVIAGRPETGKTALLLQLASEYSQIENIHVVFWSLDLTAIRIRQRLRAMDLPFDHIHIMDKPDLSDMDIRSAISPDKKTILMIDFYQKMFDPSQRDDADRKEILNRLSALVQEQNVHLILNSSLPRSVADLPQGKPTADFYKAGAETGFLFPFEQANLIALLWEQYQCVLGIRNLSDDREIIIAKNDFGQTGVIQAKWNPEYLLYEFPEE